MLDLSPWLPAGYRSRPATAADISAIHHLVAACELQGRAETDLDAIAAVLARPGLDPASDTLLVHDPAGELIAWAWVDRRSEVDVHPDHRGRRVGSFLLAWVETRARQAGSQRIVQTVPDSDRAATTLLRSHGYEPMVTAWLLEIAMPSEPAVPEPPAGITVRSFQPGDEPAVYQLTEDAFDEWQERRKSYQEWARLTVERATFAPALSSVALDGDQLVGAVLSLDVPDADEGYVERVAGTAGSPQSGDRPGSAAPRVPRLLPAGPAMLHAVDTLGHRRAVAVRTGGHDRTAQLHGLSQGAEHLVSTLLISQ